MTLAADTTASLDGLQHIVLDDISWDLYEHLLREVSGSTLRVTYHRGSVEIMSPLPKHETWKKAVAGFIEAMAFELNVPIRRLGSTTFRLHEREAGLEPDECYYVQNVAAVRGKQVIELPADPPPDLALEIDIARRSISREPIYAALGVPELWRYDGRGLHVLKLMPQGRYEPQPASEVFPFLPVKELERFIVRFPHEDDTAIMRDYLNWVRTLKP